MKWNVAFWNPKQFEVEAEALSNNNNISGHNNNGSVDHTMVTFTKSKYLTTF